LSQKTTMTTRASRGTAAAALLLVFFALWWEPATSSSAAGTETLVGIQGRDFVILGADSSVSQSIALTASNLDKIAVLVDPFPNSDNDNSNSKKNAKRNLLTRQQCIVAAVAGDAADADRLVGTLTAHAAIREYEAGVGCDVDVVDCRFENRTDAASDPPDIATSIATSSVGTTSAPAGVSVQDAAHLARHVIASRLRSSAPLKVCLLVAGMMPVRTAPDGCLAPSTGKVPYVQRRRQPLPRLIVPSMSTASDASRAGQGSPSERVQQQVRHATMPAGGQARGDPMPLLQSDMDTDQPPPLRLEPRLFWLDEYGSIQRLAYGAHGFGSNFALSILDEGYRTDLTKEHAIELMKSCFDQLRLRYVINSPQPPCIKCVDRHGCHLVR
jgi:20S proteasome alpha/beta subunit